MPQWVPVKVSPGVQRGSTPYDIPGTWWDANLIRWQSGSMIPVGGNSRITAAPLSAPIRRMHAWRDNGGLAWLAAGLETGLRIITDTNNDITPASFVPEAAVGVGGYGALNYGEDTYGTPRASQPAVFMQPRHWTFANWGQDLMAVASQDGRLLHWAPQAGTPYPVADVPSNAPTNNTACAVTAERSVVLIGASGNPRRVAWSDRENYNGWTFSSTTGQAGYLDLEATSALVTALRVRDGVLILSNREVFLLRYVGAPYFYGVDKLGSTIFDAPRAICQFANMAIWFGTEGFWKYDGGQITPVSCPFLNDIFDDMDPTYGKFRCHMSDNGVFPEVWFFYPSNGQTECDKYVIWNPIENWWVRGSMPRTCMIGAETAEKPYAAGVDRNIYRQEDGWTDAGISRVGQVWAETAVLDGDSGGDQVKQITQAMPGGTPSDPSNYQMRFMSRFTPNGPETSFGPYLPRTDGYMDLRVSGRDIRMRIEATTDAPWSMGQSRLLVGASGKR